MAAEQHNHRIQPLNGNNYTIWSEEMKALLRSKGLWRLVDGKEMRPSTPAKEQEAWDIKQDRAAGELMLNLCQTSEFTSETRRTTPLPLGRP
jgi:hypothetical protein